MPSGSGEGGNSTFQYQHPNTDYTVELRVVEGAVECPGCGEARKQLVRHLKSDKSCQKKCVEIDLMSFDKQLKAFRHLNSVKSNQSKQRGENEARFLEKHRDQEKARKERRKVENEEEFLETQRGQEQARKGRRKEENEEEFLEKQRKQEQARKGQRKEENEEEFLEKHRKQEQVRKGRRKEENEEEFLEKHHNQEKARKERRKEENEEEFLEKQRNQQQARKLRRKEENEEEFLQKQRDQEQARKRRRKDEDENGFLENHRGQEQVRKKRRKDQDADGFLENQRGQKQASRRRSKEKQKGAIGRARKFRRAIMLADVFICSCCERRLFEQNVIAMGDLREKVEDKKAGLFDRCIPVLKERALVSITINGKKNESHYICHACKGHLLKGKMPPMCAENGLKKGPISDDNLKLTELERNMIALRIPFTKMVMLKKSRYNLFDNFSSFKYKWEDCYLWKIKLKVSLVRSQSSWCGVCDLTTFWTISILLNLKRTIVTFCK